MGPIQLYLGKIQWYLDKFSDIWDISRIICDKYIGKGTNTLTFCTNTLVFGTNTVVFGESVLVFGTYTFLSGTKTVT